MNKTMFSIGQFSERAGLSRRAIRFYVERGLLPPPVGRGRGSGYTQEHLDRTERIRQFQAEGHSLDAIQLILRGQPIDQTTAAVRRTTTPAAAPARLTPKQSLSARLWTRLRLADGVELHIDTMRFNPDVSQLLAIREAVHQILNLSDASDQDS